MELVSRLKKCAASSSLVTLVTKLETSEGVFVVEEPTRASTNTSSPIVSLSYYAHAIQVAFAS